jgi:hypothetical protein
LRTVRRRKVAKKRKQINNSDKKTLPWKEQLSVDLKTNSQRALTSQAEETSYGMSLEGDLLCTFKK